MSAPALIQIITVLTYSFLLETCINQESDEEVKLNGFGRMFLNSFWQLRKLEVLLGYVVQELNWCIDKPFVILAYHVVLTYMLKLEVN